ncbi:hypothetical protein HPPC_02635 [Helicobacter pylori PeCan4]|uniref:Uncharacterized protein n=1 Tax=Helicobacter pylori (strain Cuz20) TaxID=765964 RepID=A0AB32X776_HELPC|nr:hypothetical protein HPCU_02920 [Helicobacter pylori Cuz20]ADO06765.1 hypothetical protein HPPC_02635 [Helicobacter pylori PeCan4]AEN15145.1 hypothetical protein HPPN120_02600 [Helicobacter pylori Puno120]AFI01076.1 hypothetical protein HPSH112_04375 [Helicobacter pylori Shi112]
MENHHHTKNKIANTLNTELFLKNAPLNLKSWSLGLRLLWVFKNKESLENLRYSKKFVFYLLKLKNATKPF